MNGSNFKDYRLVPIALATWLIAGWSIGFPQAATEWIVGGAAITCGGLVCACLQRSRPTYALQIAIVGIVVVVFAAHPQRYDRSQVLEAAEDGFVLTVQGKIVTEPTPSSSTFGGSTLRFALDTTSVQLRGKNLKNVSRLQVLLPQEGESGELPVTYGAHVRFAGKLHASSHSARDGITITPTTALVLDASPNTLHRVTNEIRRDLRSLTAPMSEQARALVPGAAIGDTSAMSQQLKEEMKVSGLTHITAVSGSHFAVLFVALGALTARLPRLVRATVLALVSLGFVYLVHPSGAVLRASSMAAIALVALVIKRPSQALAALAFSVIALLIFDPFNASDIGFALSVVATAAIIEGSKPLARWLHKPTEVHTLIPEKLAIFVAVPLAAQLAVLPLLALLQPFIGTYGLVANLLAAPVVAPTAILSLLAALFASWWHDAALICATLASGGTWWIAFVARTISAFPGAKVSWPQGLLGAVLALALVAALISCARLCVRIALSVRTRRTRRILDGRGGMKWPRPLFPRHPPYVLVQAARETRSLRSGATIAVAILAVCTLVLTFKPPWLTRVIDTTSHSADWSVLACDVGQGDAFVVKSETKNVYMVDTGPPNTGLLHCLDAQGITKISTLFLSHYHSDHVGGLEELLGRVEVEEIVVGPPIGDAGTIAAVAAVAARHDTPIYQYSPERNMVAPISLDRAAKVSTAPDWEILWPSSRETANLLAASEYGETMTNDASLVVHFPHLQGNVAAIFLGDLEIDGQDRLARELASRNDLHGVDVVKMAHHGSKSQSATLTSFLRPAVTVVGVGSNNTYGHPSTQAVQLYAQHGSSVLRTDQCGSFKLSRESDRWFVVGHCP